MGCRSRPHSGAFQRAFRGLLTQPVVARPSDPLLFGLVRRYSAELTAHADRTLGARLELPRRARACADPPSASTRTCA